MHARRIPVLAALAISTLATLAVGGTSLGATAEPATAGAAGTAPAASTPAYAGAPIALGPDAPQGAAPAILWAEGTTIHLEDGTSFELPDDGYGDVADLARLGDRIVTTRYRSDNFQAGPRLSIFEVDGTQVGWTGLGRDASADLVSTGDVVAFLQHDQVVLVEDDGATWIRHFAPVDPGLQVEAVVGDSCTLGCVVYLDGSQSSYVMDSTVGDPEQLIAPIAITDARSTPSGIEILGMHSLDEEDVPTAFWGPTDDWGSVVWSQDDYSTDSYSPDASLVLGLDSFNEGAGSGTLAFLDAVTGEPVVEFEHVEGWYVADRAWEDADHVIITLYDGNATSVLLRVGTAGTVERLQSEGSDTVRLGA